ncbi:MAG: glycine zipper 2TM domain-containing protein [Caulobacteraceae bacterium]|nr:glycine zipper 2TM domain-containing protein [Caulobacteraceae bacterium]
MQGLVKATGWLCAVVMMTAAGGGPVQAQPGLGPPPPGYEPGYAYGDPDVPPPDGYNPRDGRYDSAPSAQEEDRRYAEAVQRWAAESCIDQRNQNQAAGAVIGGVLGAILGSSVSGRHDRGAGMVVGGALGAIAGSAIGASATSPGCPPGYGVRPGAPPFEPPVFGGGVAYVAPPGYRPWIWNDGRWGYRPYPYHRYWYHYEQRHYRGDRR